ncbi:hypothetical protein TNCV_344531, partial [Trichonephila clavipes]
ASKSEPMRAQSGRETKLANRGCSRRNVIRKVQEKYLGDGEINSE